MNAVLPLAAILAFYQSEQPQCVAEGETFGYPPLARAAAVQGEVNANVTIGDDGVVAHADYSGPPLLASFLAESIGIIRFPPRCAGKQVDLRFTYRLIDEAPRPPGITRLAGPNHWDIEVEPFHEFLAPATIGLRHWWQRIFHR